MAEPIRDENVGSQAGAGDVPAPADGSPPAAADEKPPDPTPDERLVELEAERDEYLRDLQRVAADFDNFRKRATREQESLVARAHERLMKALLPVLDELERALETASADGRATEDDALRDGVHLVARELRAALEREGLEEIPTDGAFDPHVHEALLAQPSDAEEGSVIQVLQKGYRLGDRVLRPARVVVAAAPPAPAEE